MYSCFLFIYTVFKGQETLVVVPHTWVVSSSLSVSYCRRVSALGRLLHCRYQRTTWT